MSLLSIFSVQKANIYAEDALSHDGHLLVFPVIAIWKITESVDELHRQLLSEWGEAAHGFLQLKAESRQREWLAVRLLFAHLLKAPFEIEYAPSGKPYLKNSELHISISHTKGYAAVALSRTPIGIDIEQRGGKALKIRDKFLQDTELNLRPTLSLEDDAVLLWSAKEAVYKLQSTPSPRLKEDILIYQEEENLLARPANAEPTALLHWYLQEDFILTCARFLPLP